MGEFARKRSGKYIMKKRKVFVELENVLKKVWLMARSFPIHVANLIRSVLQRTTRATLNLQVRFPADLNT